MNAGENATMGPSNAATRNQNDPATITARLSLAELLSRSIEEDPTVDEPLVDRWEEDEGSSGG